VSFAVTTAAGFALAGPDSVRYWTGSVFQTDRIGNPATAADQCLQAVLARAGLDPHTTLGTAIWLALSALATADPTLIRTVLQNLLDNAWKFTSGRDEAAIEFGMTPDRTSGSRFYVRDNGAGFDTADAGKLFKPFERLHSASQFPGTGVGLASVRQIVERHGGRTWADGASGAGATFYFTLPGK
jgi:signal transduction histidine kinase